MGMVVGVRIAEQMINNQYSDPSTLAHEGIFNPLEDMRKVSDQFPDVRGLSKAEERATLITDYLKQKGIKTGKMWVIFTKEYITTYNFHWHYHVAPVAYVREGEGIRPMVLDPKWISRPYEVDSWTEYHMPRYAKCRRINKFSDTYYVNEKNCYLLETGPEVKDLRDLMALEWQQS